jgi:hypothetical protein
MAWGAWIASAFWAFSDDPRAPMGSGKMIAPGSVVILATAESNAATAAGTISGAASLNGGQTTTLAAMQGLASRGPIVQALGLS